MTCGFWRYWKKKGVLIFFAAMAIVGYISRLRNKNGAFSILKRGETWEEMLTAALLKYAHKRLEQCTDPIVSTVYKKGYFESKASLVLWVVVALLNFQILVRELYTMLLACADLNLLSTAPLPAYFMLCREQSFEDQDLAVTDYCSCSKWSWALAWSSGNLWYNLFTLSHSLARDNYCNSIFHFWISNILWEAFIENEVYGQGRTERLSWEFLIRQKVYIYIYSEALQNISMRSSLNPILHPLGKLEFQAIDIVKIILNSVFIMIGDSSNSIV